MSLIGKAIKVFEQRAARDLPDLSDKASLGDIIKAYNDLNSQLSGLTRGLSLQSNFDGQIVKITFAAGETLTIPHKLGVLPRYRIILGQEGNGVLDDIPSGWNTFQIKMKNNGAVSVTATIMLVRE